MDEEFVPLWVFLRATQSDFAVESAQDLGGLVNGDRLTPESAEAISSARLFRAAVADAVEATAKELLREIAHEVLGRELQLGPCDVTSIVRNALARHAGDQIVAIRAHRDDLSALSDAGIDCVADETLHRGDVILVLRSGTINMTLHSRLSAVLEGAAA